MREAAQGHPARWHQSQSEIQATWLSVWPCGQNPVISVACQAQKTATVPLSPSILEKPRNPNQESAQRETKSLYPILNRGKGWLGGRQAALEEEGGPEERGFYCGGFLSYWPYPSGGSPKF